MTHLSGPLSRLSVSYFAQRMPENHNFQPTLNAIFRQRHCLIPGRRAFLAVSCDQNPRLPS
ncbi:hypothetical protein ACTXT7_008963 [Hymenolepis weldensis]